LLQIENGVYRKLAEKQMMFGKTQSVETMEDVLEE